MPQTCVMQEEGLQKPICMECMAMEMELWFHSKQAKLPIGKFMDGIGLYSDVGSDCNVCGEEISGQKSDIVFDATLLDGDNKLTKKFMECFNYKLEVV